MQGSTPAPQRKSLITPNGENMWTWDLESYLNRAYDSAVATFLRLDGTGCEHNEGDECMDTCTDSFYERGFYDYRDVVFSSELQEAMEGIIMLYWPALANLKMNPESFGYDFILSAGGHGSGFWDHGYGRIGEELTADCRPHGDISGYIDYDTGLVNITM